MGGPPALLGDAEASAGGGQPPGGSTLIAGSLKTHCFSQVPQPVQLSEWTVGMIRNLPSITCSTSVIASPRIGQTR